MRENSNFRKKDVDTFQGHHEQPRGSKDDEEKIKPRKASFKVVEEEKDEKENKCETTPTSCVYAARARGVFVRGASREETTFSSISSYFE